MERGWGRGVRLGTEIGEGLIFSSLFREWIEELTSVLLVCQLWSE